MSKAQYALVGDIGGTNARFALVARDSFELEHIQVLPCNDYANLDEAVRDYLAGHPEAEVHEACMAFACPVHGDTIKMTNNHWTFNKADMQARLGFDTFKYVNDFTAMALGTLHVADERLQKVGGGEGKDGAARLVIGPGTGLGVSGLVRTMTDWAPLSTEGGHVDFAPTNELEISVLRILKERFGRVSVERILCGEGLLNLYRSLCEIDGVEPAYTQPSQVSEAALANSDLIAQKTLKLFCAIFGRVAGNAALTLGALGGVYVCGGIIPRFIEFFRDSDFRQCFEDKGRMRDYLGGIPVYVVTETYTGLLGAAEALKNQEVH
ncbi:glucokinase [Hahella aquimaris]|uniref:glucokinase n=1 Tax=Hahella sp. HNIBRBA332 TaxID=3015983 RepID=UPI00273CE81B|nr:glucokinase [Hahella sp. HNIBRBA332]WLQ12709.1 glucokinase [Hahella sp. HNIBRBA332]